MAQNDNPLFFKQISTVRADKDPRIPCTSLAISHKYGIAAIAISGQLHIAHIDKIMNPGGSKEIGDLFKTKIPANVLTSTEDILAVGVQDTVFLLSYLELVKDQPHPISTIKGKSEITQISFNPTDPTMIAILSSDGNLKLSKIGLQSTQMFSYNDTQIKCICFSPKGKQIVVGHTNGEFSQLKLDLTLAKKFPGHGPGAIPVSLHWVSTTQFIAMFRSGDEVCVSQIDQQKGGAPLIVSLGDIFVSDTVNEKSQSFFNQLNPETIICSSSTSSEIIALTKSPSATNWTVADIDDSRRAALPIDNYSVGGVLYYNHAVGVSFNESEVYGPMPVYMIASQFGTISTFSIVNKDGLGEGSKLSKTQTLTWSSSTSGQQVGFPAQPQQVSAVPAQVQPQPQVTVTPPTPFTFNPNAPFSFATSTTATPPKPDVPAPLGFTSTVVPTTTVVTPLPYTFTPGVAATTTAPSAPLFSLTTPTPTTTVVPAPFTFTPGSAAPFTFNTSVSGSGSAPLFSLPVQSTTTTPSAFTTPLFTTPAFTTPTSGTPQPFTQITPIRPQAQLTKTNPVQPQPLFSSTGTSGQVGSIGQQQQFTTTPVTPPKQPEVKPPTAQTPPSSSSTTNEPTTIRDPETTRLRKQSRGSVTTLPTEAEIEAAKAQVKANDVCSEALLKQFDDLKTRMQQFKQLKETFNKEFNQGLSEVGRTIDTETTKLNKLEDFNDKMEKTCQVQNNEVNLLKEKSVTHYSQMYYAKSLEERNRDPKYLQILRSQPMNPATLKSLREIDSTAAYIRNQIQECRRYQYFSKCPPLTATETYSHIQKTLAAHAVIIKRIAREHDRLRQFYYTPSQPSIELDSLTFGLEKATINDENKILNVDKDSYEKMRDFSRSRNVIKLKSGKTPAYYYTDPEIAKAVKPPSSAELLKGLSLSEISSCTSTESPASPEPEQNDDGGNERVPESPPPTASGQSTPRYSDVSETTSQSEIGIAGAGKSTSPTKPFVIETPVKGFGIHPSTAATTGQPIFGVSENKFLPSGFNTQAFTSGPFTIVPTKEISQKKESETIGQLVQPKPLFQLPASTTVTTTPFPKVDVQGSSLFSELLKPVEPNLLFRPQTAPPIRKPVPTNIFKPEVVPLTASTSPDKTTSSSTPGSVPSGIVTMPPPLTASDLLFKPSPFTTIPSKPQETVTAGVTTEKPSVARSLFSFSSPSTIGSVASSSASAPALTESTTVTPVKTDTPIGVISSTFGETTITPISVPIPVGNMAPLNENLDASLNANVAVTPVIKSTSSGTEVTSEVEAVPEPQPQPELTPATPTEVQSPTLPTPVPTQSAGGEGDSATATGSIFGLEKTPSTTSIFGVKSTPEATTPAPAIAATPSIFGQSGTSIFGQPPASTPPSNSIFGQPAAAAAVSTTATAKATPPSIFGLPASTSLSGTSIFGQATSTATTTASGSTSIFGQPSAASSSIFGQPTSTSAVAASPTSIFGQVGAAAQSTTPSAFGDSSAKPTSSIFGTPSSTTQASSIFGQPPKITSIFGQPQSPPSGGIGTPSIFGQSSTTGTSVGAFGQAITPAPSVFGQSPSSAVSPSSIFGGGSTSSTTANAGSTTSIFGQSSSVFGQPTQQTQSIFGQSSGTQSQSEFGQSTTSPKSVFGQVASSPSVFGQSSSIFGQQSTSVFGQASPATSTSQANPFGSPFGGSGSAFGSKPAGSIFGGSPVCGGGGATTGTGAFGSSAQTPASPESIFGSNAFSGLGSSTGLKSPAAGIFGGGSTFGQNTSAAASIFGQASSTSVFGTPVQQQSQSAFGSSAFGSSSTPSAFGSSSTTPSAFGSNSTPSAFGSGSTPSAFGSLGGSPTTATPAFGSPPVFGSPSFGTTSFGSSTSAFGSSSSTGTGSIFGGSTVQQGTIGFGQLAQQSTGTTPFQQQQQQSTGFGFASQQQPQQQQQQQSPAFGGSSFSSWR